jgi:hypothetical protein
MGFRDVNNHSTLVFSRFKQLNSEKPKEKTRNCKFESNLNNKPLVEKRVMVDVNKIVIK